MRILLSVLLLLVLVPGWSGASRLDLFAPGARIRLEPVSLDPADPSRRRVGALEWRGGALLIGNDSAFGGFSSLAVARGRVTLLSDGGNIVSFGLRHGRVVAPWFGALASGPAAGWEKRDRDSESMALDPATGTAWVGFENSDSIWRYAPGPIGVPGGGAAQGWSAPPAMAHWSVNGGPESLARMPDGSFVTMSETDPWRRAKGWDKRGRAAIRFAGDPVLRPRAGFRFTFVPPSGFDVSDTAALPNGDLLVLTRRWTPLLNFSTKIVRVAAGVIRPGAIVAGRAIATLAPPLIHENFEGLAVTHEGDDTMLWLVSDDNQTMFQRSLLLKFRLIG